LSRIRFGDITLVIMIGIFWGVNWPAVKFLLSEIPPWSLRAIGMSCGAVLLAGLATGLKQPLRPAKAELLPMIGAGLLTVMGFNVFAALGQVHSLSSTAVIIAFTMPMWTAVFSVAFLREHMTPRRLGSLVVGMSGLLLLISEDANGFLARPEGPLLMLGAAISWAAGTVVLKSRVWSIKPIAQAAWMMAVSAPPTIVVALLTEYDGHLGVPSTAVIATLAYHLLFPMVLCYAVWTVLVGRLPASVASMSTLLVPIVGVISAALLLGDVLSWQKVAALALVLVSIGLTFARLDGRKKADE
jgi:drug/metabolite transporter (DMT)-like permease